MWWFGKFVGYVLVCMWDVIGCVVGVFVSEVSVCRMDFGVVGVIRMGNVLDLLFVYVFWIVCSIEMVSISGGLLIVLEWKMVFLWLGVLVSRCMLNCFG